MDELIAFLRARLDEDEAWALACNRPYRYADEGSVAPATGVHWQWVAGEIWEPVTPDPAVMEFVEGTDRVWSVNLATVEEWPKTYRNDDGSIMNARTMPTTYATEIVEMDPAAAGHIARHDPARVLADVAAKRAIMAVHCRRDSMPWWDPALYEGEGARCQGCNSDSQGYPATPDINRCPTLLALASAFADHPNFRAEWRLGAGTTPPGE